MEHSHSERRILLGSGKEYSRVLKTLWNEEKILSDFRNQFFAADIFNPEKIVRLSAYSAAVVYVALFVFLPLLALHFGASSSYHLLQITQLHPSQLETLLVILAILSFPLAISPLAKFLLRTYVSIRLGSKAERIDRNFHSAITIFLGCGRGGLSVIRAIETVMESRLSGISEEFRKVLNMVQVEGKTLSRALIDVSLTTPSHKLGGFLSGLANTIEQNRDYYEYVENYTTLEGARRKIEIGAHVQRLMTFSTVYIVALTILVASIVVGIVNSLTESSDVVPFLVYLVLPALSGLLSAIFYIGSMEKEVKREKEKQAKYLVAFTILLGTLAVYLPYPELVKDLLIVAALSTAITGYVAFFKLLSQENKLETQLSTFLSKLYSASSSGMSLTNALKTLSLDPPLGTHLRRIVAMSDWVSLPNAFKEEAKNTRDSYLASIFHVLSRVSNATQKISGVLSAITSEFHRYTEYQRAKKSTAKSATFVILFGYFTMLFCLAIVKQVLLPTFAKTLASHSESLVPGVGRISLNTDLILTLSNDSAVLAALFIPLSVGFIRSDFRTVFGPMLFMLVASVLFRWLL